MIFIPHLDLIMIRSIQYISGAMYVGMLFFYLCILPNGSLQSASIERHYRKIFNLAFILLFISSLLNPLEAIIQGNRSWLNGSNPSILKILLTSTAFGQVWCVQLIVTLLLYFLSFRFFVKKNNLLLWIAFILGITLLVLQVISHADLAENNHLAITMDSLHLIAGSLWIGSLIAIAALLPLRKREEGKVFFRGIVHLFFPWGVFFVLIFAVTSVFNR